MSIRVRLAILFAAASALVVFVGSAIYLHILTHELHTTIDSGLQLQANAVRSGLSHPGTSPQAALAGVAALQQDDLAQIFGPNGKLVASSSTTGSVRLLGPVEIRRARRSTFTVDPRIHLGRGKTGDDEHIRLRAGPIQLSNGRGVLAVGTSLVWTDAALDHISDTAIWGGPIVVVLAGLAAWLLAAAALRPVERMRRQAATMSAEQATTQIVVPATRDEIAALARTMNDLLVRLRGALARERMFVADAGHELRTPLAILRAELELASRPGRNVDDLRAAVADAAEESRRLSQLANDLLVLARDATTGTSAPREPTVVAELFAAAVSYLASRAARAEVTVQVDAPADLVADIDPASVRRLVDNVLDNAIRATPPGGTIVVRAAADRDRLRIEVRDTGPGFPVDFLPHAFERFRRADAARARHSGGTGLGLAIVRSIAEAHHGTAQAANAPGGGALLTVELAEAILVDTPSGTGSVRRRSPSAI